MQNVVLGRTGLRVSRLAFGGLFVASFATDLEKARQAVTTAISLGVNYFDTAPGYGNSEEVLGQALAAAPGPVILSTKLGGRPQPFKPQDKDCLMQSVTESLRLLGRGCIDILMVHEPDRPGQYEWWTNWRELSGPVLELAAELKKQGIIKHIGLGGTTVHEMAHLVRSGKFDVVLTAYNYSLLWREAADAIFPAAQAHNVGIIIGSPLQQGVFAGKHEAAVSERTYWLSPGRREQFRQLYALSDQCEIPVAEMAMRFVISNPAVHCVLMGSRSEEEVRANVAAVEKGPLPAEILRRLDQIASLVPFRPCCEPFGLGWLLRNPDRYKGPGQV
jgi:aryl-alcohol dehydrogenase-like predicted oxidoreductase